MSEHIESSLKKAISRVNLLKSIRCLIDSDIAAKIYNAMIQPILTHSPFSTCGTISQTLENRIKNAEARAQRIIGLTPVIQSSELIKKKRIAVFVHQCISNENVCENFRSYFTLKNSRICTRNNNIMVHLPYVKLEVARKSFYFLGAKIYNDLPRNIRLEKDISKFKALLKSL